MENELMNLSSQQIILERHNAKERNKLARAEAKKFKAEAMFKLQQEVKKQKDIYLLETKKIKENKSLSDEEKKNQFLEVNKQLKLLKVYYRKEKKNIVKHASYEGKNRHFISSLDAFFSRPPMWIVNLIFVLIFVGIFIYFGIGSGLFSSSQGGTRNLIAFAKGFFVPDYDLFFGTGDYEFTASVFFLCLQTFGIAFMGTLFSAILALPFGFLASKKLFGNYSYISMLILIIIRTIPEIVFCYIMVRVTGFSPMTGVVVLSIQSIGMIGKMYSDNLDSLDFSYLEALDSSGASKPTKIIAGVLPQVFPNFISTILYRFDLNLRTASILGLVGAGDLGRLILTYSQNSNWPQLGALIWGLLILVLLVDFISTSIRKHLV